VDGEAAVEHLLAQREGNHFLAHEEPDQLAAQPLGQQPLGYRRQRDGRTGRLPG
jgi:hypothetical protein